MGISKSNDRLTIIINKDLKKQLEQVAKKDNRSTSNYVSNILEEHIKEQLIQGLTFDENKPKKD